MNFVRNTTRQSTGIDVYFRNRDRFANGSKKGTQKTQKGNTEYTEGFQVIRNEELGMTARNDFHIFPSERVGREVFF